MEIQKLTEMLTSTDKEMVDLGMSVCKEKYPFVWASLIGFTGRGPLTSHHLVHLGKYPGVGIGSTVKYRGLDGGPKMVITQSQLQATGNTLMGESYSLVISAKYYNKSKQEFQAVTDRIECFELLLTDKKDNENGSR